MIVNTFLPRFDSSPDVRNKSADSQCHFNHYAQSEVARRVHLVQVMMITRTPVGRYELPVYQLKKLTMTPNEDHK